MDDPEGPAKWVSLVKNNVSEPTQTDNYPFSNTATVRMPVGMWQEVRGRERVGPTWEGPCTPMRSLNLIL